MLKVHAKKLNTVQVLSLEGQIVIGNTDTLRNAVQSAGDASEIILDLANVAIVDAHGLGVLLQMREQTVANGAHFALKNVSQPLSRIFEITGLDTVFEVNSGVNFFPKPWYAPRVLAAA
jgi:anti-anti-sigma factor